MGQASAQRARRGATRPLSTVDKMVVLWMAIDAFTHLNIEMMYLCVALGPTAAKSDSLSGYMWREYGRADARWAVRDPIIISLELVTVLLLGPMCIWLAYAVIQRKPYRHVLQMVISSLELYGGWMTFAPEWLDGSPNLNTSTFLFKWVYLAFMNGLWVLVPGILLWESAVQLTQACTVAKTEEHDTRVNSALPGMVWWRRVIPGALILYGSLVPLALLVYADPPPPE